MGRGSGLVFCLGWVQGLARLEGLGARALLLSGYMGRGSGLVFCLGWAQGLVRLEGLGARALLLSG